MVQCDFFSFQSSEVCRGKKSGMEDEENMEQLISTGNAGVMQLRFEKYSLACVQHYMLMRVADTCMFLLPFFFIKSTFQREFLPSDCKFFPTLRRKFSIHVNILVTARITRDTITRISDAITK